MNSTMLDYWVKRYQEHGQWTVGPYNNPVMTQTQRALFEHMMASRLRAESKDQRFKRGLDFGCGPGRFTEFLKSFVEDYVGYDPIPEAIRFALGAFPSTKGVTFTSEFPEGEFDLFVAITVFQHIPDDELEGILVRLKPKLTGTVIVIENNLAFDPGDHVWVRSARFLRDRLGLKSGYIQVAADLSHYLLLGDV